MSQEQPRYTTIIHKVRIGLDISCNEYCVADMISALSNNPSSKIQGWCYASKQTIADFMGINKSNILDIIDRLVKKGLVEKDSETKYLRTTALWYQSVVLERIKMKNITGGETPPSVLKQHHSGGETIPTAGGETIPTAGGETIPNNNNVYNHNNKNSATQSVAPVNVRSFFRRNKKDDGVQMTLQEFVLMCRGSDQRHVRLIGEYAESKESNYSTRGQWRVFGLRNMRIARDITPFTDRQIDSAIEKLEKDLKSNGGFISEWTMETLGKYLLKV